MKERILAGKTCYLSAEAPAGYLLIQAVDPRDGSDLDGQIGEIARLTGADFRLCAFVVDDWNADLSPWSAPPVFGRQPFAGNAPATLRFLTEDLLPELAGPGERLILGGYSLAGLFALWAVTRTDSFEAVAAASPSVWFPGWLDYLRENPVRAGRVRLSLGDRESRARNPAMARVGEAIQATQEILSGYLDSDFTWNPGNHFAEPDLRTARAFARAMDT